MNSGMLCPKTDESRRCKAEQKQQTQKNTYVCMPAYNV